MDIVANSIQRLSVPQVSLVGDPLARSVLSALAYADLFDYPLTAEELWRYQVGTSYSQEEISFGLSALPDLQCAISREGEFFCLRQRESVFETRRVRGRESLRLWKRASIYSWFIARLPFVRMVAITGALAVDNISTRPDIDLLIVAAEGRVWIARRIIIGLVHMARLFRDELCPNYIISSSDLDLQQKDLFTAHELAQMVPMYGRRYYQEMLERNSWAWDYLPVAFEAPSGAIAPIPKGIVKRLAERALSLRRLERWERWEMRRLRNKLRPVIGDAAEVVCSPQQCKGHTGLHRQRVTTRYGQRLFELGL